MSQLELNRICVMIFPLEISLSKFMPKLPVTKMKKEDIILRSKISFSADENDICPDSMKFTVRTC